MLTIFTTCRPFRGEMETIQRNAMTSWTLLEPRPKVVVIGLDHGVIQFCEEMGFSYIDVKRSQQGTPMLDDMIRITNDMSETDTILLVSSDVVLFQEAMSVIPVLQAKFKDGYCAVSRKKIQRNITSLDFNSDWRKIVEENTQLSMVTSGDFWMYPKDFWTDFPPFIIGRCKCDSYMFQEAARRKVLVDVTEAVPIIDYKHNYPSDGSFLDEKEINQKVWDQHRIDGIKAHFRGANWKIRTELEVIKWPS